ncbi:MAG: type II secretion system protein, partial [Dehalococcoidia bacterium]
MRMLKRSEKGFTLIELLIVVAILGILAAVVVPNVGRFLGRGEDEARRAEYHDVATAVTSGMVDNDVSTLSPTADTHADCTTGTKDMDQYPDITYTGGATVTAPDTAGITMFAHDKDKEDATAGIIRYLSFIVTKYCYTVD